jgi:hypothetical protein
VGVYLEVETSDSLDEVDVPDAGDVAAGVAVDERSRVRRVRRVVSNLPCTGHNVLLSAVWVMIMERTGNDTLRC